MSNEFLEKEDPDFLAKNHAVYIADISPAPSLIRSMFILPDLKKLKFPILLITDEKLSAEYSKGMDKEKIIVVSLDDLKIRDIKAVTSVKELQEALKDKSIMNYITPVVNKTMGVMNEMMQ